MYEYDFVTSGLIEECRRYSQGDNGSRIKRHQNHYI